MKRIPLLIVCIALFLASCAQGSSSKSSDQGYDQTKKMIVDILKTDDGKKAIQSVLADDKVKNELVLDEAVVKKTIGDVLLSDQGQKFWQKAFSDPQFATTFAKSMEKEQTNLMKTLLKDPDYQKGLTDIMKNPDVEKIMLNVMQSTDYRKYVQQVINETASSPLFQSKMIDTLSKAMQQKSGGGSSGSETKPSS
ncbi:spore germination lipoprotein GerD [Ectobacillus polymachus]|uniref:spore germination lipoprotein GerD n=1 Tax=Ectobacillus polymachus TaxID=1508806 RepID=UPI003A836B96